MTVKSAKYFLPYAKYSVCTLLILTAFMPGKSDHLLLTVEATPPYRSEAVLHKATQPGAGGPVLTQVSLSRPAPSHHTLPRRESLNPSRYHRA